MSVNLITKLFNNWFKYYGINVTSKGQDFLHLQDYTIKISPVETIFNITDNYAELSATKCMNFNNFKDAFLQITTQLGNPIELPMRDTEYTHRRKSLEDNFDDISLFYSDFCRVPNPNPEILNKYKNIIESASKVSYHKMQYVYDRNMLEINDLMCYARVWTCSFIGLHSLEINEFIGENDNHKLLYRYLLQKFYSLSLFLQRKERNVLPDYQTYNVCINKTPFETFHFIDITKQIEPLKISGTIRKETAIKLLDEKLGQMDHETYIKTLTDVIENSVYCKDTKNAAKNKLRKHRKICDICQKKVIAQKNTFQTQNDVRPL
jgi:hypothetical protein